MGPIRMRTSSSRFSSPTESLLVRDDNLIIGSARTMHLATPDAWPRHLGRYWNGVRAVLTQVLSGVATSTGCQIVLREEARLDSVETYWEFAHPTPIVAVDGIEKSLRSIASETDRRQYSFIYQSSGMMDNSSRISAHLTKGVGLKIYAKTSGRIRFEIVHDLKDRTNFAGHARTLANASLFVPTLVAIANDAASTLNGVLEGIQSLMAPAEQAASAFQLVRVVLRASASALEATQILEMLTVNGRVGLLLNDPIRPTIRKLARNGTLIRSSRGSGLSIYTVTPRYRLAVEALASGGPPMTGI